MLVFCEECGRKYLLDPEKTEGTEARFKCESCDHLIVVKKPEDPLGDPTSSEKKPGF
jgi:DNA-directed RNA polymerase subunit RPC12/RpoP